MYTLMLACLAGLATSVLGDPLPEGKNRLVARQGGYRYGYGYPYPPFPVSTGTSDDPVRITTSSLSTGPSGSTATGAISSSGTTSVPYGNSSVSISGTVSSTGSITYSSNDPSATITSASGDPTIYGTVSATSVTQSNITDPGYSSLTHGPYPFPTSKVSYLPSGSIGTGISQSATTIANVTSVVPTDPSMSPVYPTHGPYTRPSSLSSFTYSTSSIFGTISTAISTSDPSASPSVSANATTIPVSSATAGSYDPSLSANPSFSTNTTSITSPAGTDPSATITVSVSALSASATTYPPYFPTGTISGTETGVGDPSTISAGATTLGTSTRFSYTPTVNSQPSEYYYHHRRPQPTNQYYG